MVEVPHERHFPVKRSPAEPVKHSAFIIEVSDKESRKWIFVVKGNSI
jgi:hypothetical protein